MDPKDGKSFVGRAIRIIIKAYFSPLFYGVDPLVQLHRQIKVQMGIGRNKNSERPSKVSKVSQIVEPQSQSLLLKR